MLFCAFAVAAALVFIRLGAWQLGRLSERQTRNALIGAQLRARPEPFATLPRDTGSAHYRPASVTGRYDYEHEMVLSGRTRQGSPGVELLTPVRRLGTDTAVLVNRGWVYSPDASSAELHRWREGDSANVSGYVATYMPDTGVTRSVTGPRIIRRVSLAEIRAKVPYPVAPYYLVVIGGTDSAGHPGRRALPELDEGPHRSYAYSGSPSRRWRSWERASW
jgi:Uncharacterized conserved protein